MKHASPAVITALIALSLPACNKQKEEEPHHEHHKIVITSAKAKDVTITQQYVCQIRSKDHIELCARAFGVLEEIQIKEGQSVEQGEVLFKVAPSLYLAKYNAELAKFEVAKLEYENTLNLAVGTAPVVSQREVAIFRNKMLEAQGNLDKAQTELNFATVRAPFAGIIDRQQKQQGSTVKEGEVLTTLSNNSTMWVRFNVPEVRYLEYMAGLGQDKSLQALRDWMNKYIRIELRLADGSVFQEVGKIGTIEADFNNKTGNLTFRADFPNPHGLLRHGQTGTILIHRTLPNAVVIPQRATFERLDKRYVYIVEHDHKVHEREIVVAHELDDIFVIKSGLEPNDQIVLDGVRQVHDGEKVHCEFAKPEEVMANLKTHAE